MSESPQYLHISINGVVCRVDFVGPSKARGLHNTRPQWDMTISIEPADHATGLVKLLGPPSDRHDRDYCSVCSARENEAIGRRAG